MYEAKYFRAKIEKLVNFCHFASIYLSFTKKNVQNGNVLMFITHEMKQRREKVFTQENPIQGLKDSIPGGGGCFDSGPGFCLEAIAHAPTNRLSNF